MKGDLKNIAFVSSKSRLSTLLSQSGVKNVLCLNSFSMQMESVKPSYRVFYKRIWKILLSGCSMLLKRHPVAFSSCRDFRKKAKGNVLFLCISDCTVVFSAFCSTFQVLIV